MLEVNSYISNLPKGGLQAADMNLPKGQGTKYYYEKIMEKKQEKSSEDQKGNSKSQGNNSQSESPQNKEEREEESREQEKQKEQKEGNQYPENIPPEKKPLDTHDTWKDFQKAPEAIKQLIQSNINGLLKSTAEQIDRQQGTIPGELSELIEKLREKKPEIFNWKAYFRRMLGSIYDVNIKSTRKRDSKRFEGAAGIKHKKKVSILVAIDTSGSVSNEELQEFFSEIDYIYKAGARVTIIECDSRINKIEEYDGKNIPEICGRGGTSFDPPVEYYIKHKKEYASLIYFTDGECCLPCKKPSGMVWVITSNGYHQEYPGKVIYIPNNI